MRKFERALSDLSIILSDTKFRANDNINYQSEHTIHSGTNGCLLLLFQHCYFTGNSISGPQHQPPHLP